MNKQIHDIWMDLHQELKKFIFSKIKDIDTSNDILQDVFLKIHLNIHTLSDCSKLTSWVYQITRNTIADHFRKNKVEFSIDDFVFAEQGSEEPLYQSLSNCINLKINKLPQKYKQVIMFTAFENYSQIALAGELNISYSGAKARVQRAREKLKNLIVDCSNVEVDTKGNIIAYQANQNQ
jgi:RNA polymerase sigma-70 factor (ECF subfamily)